MAETPEERWLPVVGYEGLYEVSDVGRVRGLTRGGLLKLRVSTRGYWVCGLTKLGQQTEFRVHRLVATAFIGPPSGERREINHIDGDKLNNAVANLEWCTRAENCAHNGRMGRCCAATN